MNEKDVKPLKYVVVPVVLGLLVLWALAGLFRSRSPDADLAAATREAVEAALDAQDAANRRRTFGSVFRIAGLVVGVVGPLVVVFLIYRVRSREEIEPEEMLEVLESYGLIQIGGVRVNELSGGSGRLLDGPGDSD